VLPLIHALEDVEALKLILRDKMEDYESWVNKGLWIYMAKNTKL
jgi:hypothetical protein